MDGMNHTTMTPKLSTLSDAEKRVMIAKWMGYKPMSICNGVLRPDGEWIDRTVPFSDAIKRAAPDYLTDANAALTLCDRMAELGFQTEINQALDKTWECLFNNYANYFKWPACANADTLPLAISHAFLLANQLAEL